MADQTATKLYTPQLLALSASLAEYPLDPALPLKAEGRSRTCGSSILVALAAGDDGAITRIGMQVSACAVGQSSAAILARSAEAKGASDIEAMIAQIERWLAGEGELPDWPGFDALAPAQTHTGRYGALLLPWKAVLEALCSAQPSG